MKTIITILSVTILVTISTIVLTSATAKKRHTEGVWTVAAVQTVKPNGTITTTIPTESQVIFTNKHYSLCWTNNTVNNKNWQMTDSAKINRFNQSIVNTGKYTLTESRIITVASFAMNPMFTNGTATFEYHYAGDTLILKGLSVFSENKIAHPAYASGTYFITKLLKIK